MATTFKLLRAIGGACNFAETTVTAVHDCSSPTIEANPNFDEPSYSWGIPHAILGAREALSAFGDGKTSIVVESIRVSDVDSTPDSIAVSAFVATANALGADATVDEFVADGALRFVPRVGQD